MSCDLIYALRISFTHINCFTENKWYCITLWAKKEIARHKTNSSVQFSCSVVSNSLRPHESQHGRPPCPSPTPRVHSELSPSSPWCHPAISSSVVPFFSCPQPLPASESFPMSQLFAWGGRSTGVSASASFLPKNTRGWSLSEWTGWISLQSKGLSRVFSNTTVQKHQDSMVLAQIQKYRSMEQNRKPRDKSTHIWTPYLWQRRQEYTIE